MILRSKREEVRGKNYEGRTMREDGCASQIYGTANLRNHGEPEGRKYESMEKRNYGSAKRSYNKKESRKHGVTNQRS